MMMAMTRTQIYLTEEQRGQIQRLAKAQHKTMAQVVHEAVEEYVIQRMEIEPSSEALDSSADPLWEIIGLGSSGITDGSIHHDRDIYDED
jgi:predicted DNA-binding protein